MSKIALDEKAIADLEEAVRLEPKWVEGLVELAEAYEQVAPLLRCSEERISRPGTHTWSNSCLACRLISASLIFPSMLLPLKGPFQDPKVIPD